jgi:glycosyltransferase involved in cell wall biosynthesis
MIDCQKSLPKISCLLVTAKNRFDYFQRSVRCYADQTYPNKELLVINEGPKEYQEKIAQHLSGRQDVKLIFLDGWYSLGSLRNISIALSQGDLFVQWDDDDFNMPERLAIQYNYLSNHPKARICYLSEQLHYYFNSNYLFWEDWAQFCSGGHKRYSLIPGTIMAWREGFHYRYPSAGYWCSAGEDTVLAERMLQQGDEIVTLLSGFGYMQMYSYHGHNVYDLQHHLSISKNRSLNSECLLGNRERICRTIDYLDLPGITKVMGRDGVAFTHEANR